MSFNINSLSQSSPKRKSHAQIYIEDLMEDFTCPICFDEFEKCHTTQCGHNFCGKCIKESLNRRHTCPLCTQPATQQELIKNIHLDSILSKLQKTRETYATKYVHQLMSRMFIHYTQPHIYFLPQKPWKRTNRMHQMQ